jgi:hypothetical protein
MGAHMLNRREIVAAGAGGALSLGLAGPSFAAEDTLLTPSDIQSDIDLLQDIYQSLHPGLYRYNTQADIIARFRATKAALARPAPLSKVYLEVSKLLASVRCGHSYANFYNQSDAVSAKLFMAQNRLPFKFVWTIDKMVVTDPVGVAGLTRGTRIDRINGVPTDEILRQLLPYVRADGHNLGKQVSLLGVNRSEGFHTFDIFYGLHFGDQRRFALEGFAPTRQPMSISVDAIGLTERLAMTEKGSEAPDAPKWTLEIGADKIAILSMPTWGLYRSNWDWKAWLAASFERINTAQCKGLIIDIRGNEGGRDDIAPQILGHLTTTPLPAQSGARRVAYREVPTRLNPYLNTWDDSFRNWGDKAVAGRDRLFDLVDQTGRSGGQTLPIQPYFAGKTIVLTDASNSSATLQFCQLFRANRLGQIIGATTGGNLRGINAEKFFFANLPKTGIVVDVPLVGFFPSGNPPDGGLVPDITLEPSWLDIGRGDDVVMARAKSEAARR